MIVIGLCEGVTLDHGKHLASKLEPGSWKQDHHENPMVVWTFVSSE